MNNRSSSNLAMPLTLPRPQPRALGGEGWNLAGATKVDCKDVADLQPRHVIIMSRIQPRSLHDKVERYPPGLAQLSRIRELRIARINMRPTDRLSGQAVDQAAATALTLGRLQLPER